jgi:hypothetical protein
MWICRLFNCLCIGAGARDPGDDKDIQLRAPDVERIVQKTVQAALADWTVKESARSGYYFARSMSLGYLSGACGVLFGLAVLDVTPPSFKTPLYGGLFIIAPKWPGGLMVLGCGAILFFALVSAGAYFSSEAGRLLQQVPDCGFKDERRFAYYVLVGLSFGLLTIVGVFWGWGWRLSGLFSVIMTVVILGVVWFGERCSEARAE